MTAPRPSPAGPSQRRVFRARVQTREAGAWTERDDAVVVEAPLEIRLRWKGGSRRLGATMRTPGHDEELAAGLLYAEGIVHHASEIRGIAHEPAPGEAQEFNSVVVDLAREPDVDWSSIERPFLMSSACGVCGRATTDYLRSTNPPALRAGEPTIDADALAALPARLRAAQEAFEATGGLHATALFTGGAEALLVREDVGRHNAFDKAVGRSLLDGSLPLAGAVGLVSGRAGYELVQKAVRAGLPILAAVGAPSTLAIDVAKEFGVTLVGFLRGDRFNVYAGRDRLR
ncbi:MAG: formate dehydrogenase accessory sulfurtransferase FdhD [Euryarchaeota archaeon]|nr:formate dehydrogenase accessory sulfurtransferase FdhD [Euryarchaeota archaeon]